MTLLGWDCMYGESDLRTESSLARRAEVMATKKRVFNDRSLKLVEAMGSNGGLVRALRTVWRDH